MLAGDVAALAPSAAAILDLACGDGYLLQVLARRFERARLIGIDMSPEELASARERLGERADLQLANARALPLEDDACDAVTCHMALMLMDDAPAVLAEVARVLRPGGVFAAVVNGGRSTDAVLSAFITVLREVEQAENLALLQIGDARIQDPVALSELFAREFSDVEVRDEVLGLDGTPEQVGAALLGFYNLHRLSTHGSALIKDRLQAQMRDSAAADGTVPCSMPLRHIIAVKR